MRWAERFDLWGRGARGPCFAALIALFAGLPGVLAVPPIDRDESRFAEASAQMLESGDFVSIHFQDQPRFKKPVGIYWLQALAVAALSHVEDRAIWAYRLPSLAGAMLAAAACAWGAAAFLSPGPALLAGALLGSSFMVSTEAGIAATDGALCGAVTLAMAALGRLYLAARGGPPAGRLTKLLLWTGVALSILLKGPIGPMVMGLTLLALAIWERRVRWMGKLGWGWGLIGLAAVTLPWAMAITVVSDGAFWGAAVGGDLAPKLMGDQESHGAPFGFHLALSPLLLFPATLLAPAGALAAWRERRTPAVRFALCWLIPAWLVFEITPTKLIHYTLPLYGALAWLMASALAAPNLDAPNLDATFGPRVRALGAGLLVLAGAVFALAGPLATLRLHVPSAGLWAILAAVLFLAAAGGGAWLFWRGQAMAATAFAGAAALVAHAVLLGALVPALKPLWLSMEVVRALAAVGANPREGVAQGPVTVAGYAEPSLVFLLGADTELGGGKDAADAIQDGRPAIVESRVDDAFKAALRADGAVARPGPQVQGLDYSKGRADILRIYLPKTPGRTP
jgi:4-amino-4-deoxy-L-arabinose transferase-like glycosyltransferase